MPISFLGRLVLLSGALTSSSAAFSMIASRRANVARFLATKQEGSSVLAPKTEHDGTAVVAARGPYPPRDMQSVIEDGIAGLHYIIKNGYPSRSIPVLDPIVIPTFLKEIIAKKARAKVIVNNPKLKGLGTIKASRAPEIDYVSKTVALAFTFDELELSSDAVDVEGSYRIVFVDREKQILDKVMEIKAKDVTAEFKFDLLISDGKLKVSIDRSRSEIKFGEIDANIADKDILGLLVSSFRNSIAAGLKTALEGMLEKSINGYLQSEEGKQRETLKKMVQLYEMKKDQGLLVGDDGNPRKPQLLKGFEGIGQLPLPMFWTIPEVPVDKLEHCAVSDLLQCAKTGDVMLFSGDAPGALRIRQWTQSPYSHLGVIVKEDEILNGIPLVFHSADAPFTNALRTGEKHEGIQLNEIDVMLPEYGQYFRSRPPVAFRSLERPQRDELVEKACSEAVKRFVDRNHLRPYTDDMDALYIMGLMEIDLGSEENYFCSGLVAQVLMEYGILKDTFGQHQYAPRDFSSMYQALPFEDEKMHYGPEIVIDY